MGNLISPPQKESFVLVPPRFSVRGLTRVMEYENPMNLYFGDLFRQEVLNDLHNFRGTAAIDLLIAPEIPPTASAHVSLSGSTLTKSVDHGELHLHFHNNLAETIRAVGRLSIGSSVGVTGFGILSKVIEKGKLSLTFARDSDGFKNVGIRGESGSFLMGMEIPESVESTHAWMISRLSKEFYVGMSAFPVSAWKNIDSPLILKGSLEKRIPGTDSSYCVSSSFNLPSSELTLGFSQHLVTHRKIYNLLEDKRVKFIANYVDIAVEASSSTSQASNSSGLTRVAAGVSWQPNKNVLIKLHASTNQGIVSTLAVRNWWLPSALVAVSAGVGVGGTPFIGGRFQLSNWLTSAEYEKGQPISALPTTRWLTTADVDRFSARNHINASV